MKNNKLNIVLTGATSGIGLALASILADENHHLILVARNKEASNSLSNTIINNNNNAIWLYCDLSLQKEVEQLCESIKSQFSTIDVLINCAGIVSSNRVLTNEGVEQQLAVNHLAGFQLSQLLKENLQKSNNPKVIQISSRAVYRAKVYWNDIMFSEKYSLSKAYNQSKLLSLLCSIALADENKQIKYLSVYPGLVNTDIGLKHAVGIEYYVGKVLKNIGASPHMVALKLAAICQSDCTQYNSGTLRSLNGLAKMPQLAKNQSIINKAYNLTNQLILNGES